MATGLQNLLSIWAFSMVEHANMTVHLKTAVCLNSLWSPKNKLQKFLKFCRHFTEYNNWVKYVIFILFSLNLWFFFHPILKNFSWIVSKQTCQLYLLCYRCWNVYLGRNQQTSNKWRVNALCYWLSNLTDIWGFNIWYHQVNEERDQPTFSCILVFCCSYDTELSLSQCIW